MSRRPDRRLLVLCAFVACAGPAHERRPPRNNDAGRSAADSLLALGDSLYRQSPESAGQVWAAALSAARRSGDSIAIARALTGVGQAARPLGRYADARRLGEQALALKLRLHMRADLARSYNALGLLAWDEERLADASSLFDSTIATARATHDSITAVKATNNAGLVAQNLGAFDRARDAFQRARAGAAANHDSVTLARALDDLGALDIQLGDPASAVESIGDARRIARALGDSVTELNALGQLATAYDALGQPQRAFGLLDSATTMAHRAGQRDEEAEDLTIIADLYLDAGDYSHALDFYQRALAATDSLGRPEERGNILRSEARVQAALGNLALAMQRATDAYRIHSGGGFAYPRLADAIVLASLAQRSGRMRDAEAYLRDAHSIATRLNAQIAETLVGIADAEIAVAQRDWDRALRAIRDERRSLELAGSSAEAEALMLRSRAFEGLGQLDSALAAGRQAVAAVERVRGSYASGELRTTFVSDRANVYAGQVLLLLRMGRTSEAFEVADEARGRALVEHLAAARRDVAASGVAATDLSREQLLRRIDALVAQLAQGETRSPRERSPAFASLSSALRDSLVAARAAYEALVARAGAPRATGSTIRDGSASETELTRSLAPGEALVEYLVTPDRLVIFVLSPRGLSVRTVAERAFDLRSRVELARELIQRRATSTAARGVLAALYDLLIRPVVQTGALDGVHTLTLVPHGPLSYLPFSALVDARSGRYAVEQYVLLRVPTAASLPSLRAAANHAVLIGLPRVDVFAPFPDSLPATRVEAATVHRYYPSGREYLGARADKAALRAALESSDVVHVATHAGMNRQNPLFSAIELAPKAGGRHVGYDGLEVHELLGMRMRSPLVFLSGCETALGPSWSTGFDVGEDYTTIAQTFLYAGALDVVATLWRIDDDGAAAFAARFYGALAARTAPEALAKAQRDLISDARYASPFYWAAYEVTGGGGRAVANRAELSDKR